MINDIDDVLNLQFHEQQSIVSNLLSHLLYTTMFIWPYFDNVFLVFIFSFN